MAISEYGKQRIARENERVYKIVIISLVIALWVLAAVAVKVGADRCQPTYTEMYNVTN